MPQNLNLRSVAVSYGCGVSFPLTVWHRVNPILVHACRDIFALRSVQRLFHLPALLSEGALHHGCLGQRSVGILHKQEMEITI